MEGLFDCSWNEIVSLFLEEKKWVGKLSFFGTWESFQSSVLGHVIFSLLNVYAVWVVNSTVVLNDSGDLATIFFEELSGPVSDSAIALDNEGAVLDALGKLDFVAESLVACEFTNGVVNTKTG